MGQAKARGTFEERKAQAIIRRQAEDAQRSEEYRQRRLREREEASRRQQLIGKDGPVLVGGGERYETAAMLALAMGAAAPLLVLGDKRHSGDHG